MRSSPNKRVRRARSAPALHGAAATARIAKWSTPLRIEALEQRIFFATYYVSPGGSSSGNGSAAQPFLTIQQAASIAQPGDTVLIHGGSYHETITPANSGLPGEPITFAPYGDGAVTVDGADPVTGWTQVSGSIYQANQPWDLGEGFNQVLFDGAATTEARWPNIGSNPSNPVMATMSTVSVSSGPHGLDTATITDPSLKIAVGAWNGGIIQFFPGQQWVADSGTVISSSNGKLTFTYLPRPETGSYEVPTAGNPFYLTGKYVGLDSAGEWYRDPSTGDLYLWDPSGDDPANHVVEAKARQYSFELSGLSYITIDGINSLASTIDSNAYSNHLIINGITDQYVSQYLVSPSGWDPPQNTGLYLAGTDNVLENSTVEYSAGNGIFVGGAGNIIENDTVHDTDLDGMDTAAIRVEGSNQVIYHNTVYNTGRSGIQFSESTQSRILYNLVYNAMLQTTDGGGIYGYDIAGEGTELAYNTVYNVTSGGFGAAGLYLDNGSHNVVVDHNVTWNVNYGLKMNSPSDDNDIYNNTLEAASSSVVSDSADNMAGSVFANNIFGSATSIGSTATQTHNLSKSTNPSFVNSSANDYQLNSSSPAISAGIVLPPYTNGYAGSAPDIGAYELGLPAWVAGAGSSVALNAAPPAPSFVTATYGAAGVTLSWDNSDTGGVVGYNVYRGSGSGGPFSKLNSAPLTSGTLLDTAAQATAVVWYRVTGVNAIGNESAAVSTTVAIPTGLPLPPTDLAASTSVSQGTEQVTLNWVAAPGATAYQVQRFNPGASSYVVIADGVSADSYVDTIAADGSAYAYCVLAENGNGTSSPSNVVVAGLGSVATVSGGQVQGSGVQVQLAWTELGTETGYIVERSDAGEGNWANLVTVAPGVTSYFDVTAVPGSSYVYQIEAINPDGTLTTLATLPITVAPSATVLLTATAASGPLINLSWASSNGSTGYIVQRSADGLTNWFTIGSTTSATTFTDNSVPPGATWYYQVLATNIGGTSAPSETAVATAPGIPAPTSTPTSTPTPTPNATSVSLAATADAYVQDGSYSKTNYGSATSMLVKDAISGDGYVRTAYLKFSLNGVAPITGAALELYGSELAGAPEPSIAVAVYPVADSNWAQNTITDANAPAIGSSPLATATITGTTPKLYTFNLGTYLGQQQAAGAAYVTIAVRGAAYTNGMVGFNSNRAASNTPQLLLNTATPAPTLTPTPTPVPTPTPAPAPTPTSTTGGLTPTANSYVRDGSYAKVNYGTASQLLIKDAIAGGGYVRTAYFQFNLVGLAPITSATLELYGGELPGASIEPSIGIAAYAVSSSAWAQNSITDANAPAFAGPALASVVVFGTTAAPYSLNLTAYLQQQQALGNTTVSIALTGTMYTNGIVAFNSTNAASNVPTLLIN